MRTSAVVGLAAAAVVAACGLASAAAAPPSANRDSVRSAFTRGQYRLAETWAREMIDAARRGSAGAPDSVDAMQLLASTVFRLARHAEAESLARAAIAIRERQGESFDLALALGVLSDIRNGRGAPAEAESLSRRAIAITARVGNVDELELARIRQTLANALMDSGDLEGGGDELTRVLEIRRRRLGNENLVVAQTLHNLAIVRRRQGELTQARRLYEESLGIRERLLGRDNVDVAWSLNNLANVLYELGEFAEVRRLHERALAIRERALGPDHPDVAFSLNNLANALIELGDVDAALPLHERALAIRERVGGPMHIDVAQSLNNLAYLYARLGRYSRADSMYRRSVAIREAALGPRHPEVARTLLRLSYLLEMMADTTGARSTAERALELRRAGLGPEHYDVALVTVRLALLDWRLGHVDAAVANAVQAEDISRRHFRRMVRGLDEHSALSFSAERTSGLDLLIEMAAAPGSHARVDSIALDALVRSRALVLDELVARRRAVAAAEGDTAIHRLAQAVADGQSRLAQLVLRGPGRQAANDFAAALDAEDRDVQRAQRALAERSSVHRQLGGADEIGLEQVRRALPPGSALVSFARFLTVTSPTPDWTWGPARYVAFVTRGEADRPVRIALGPAAELDSLIDRWLALAGAAPNPLRRAADERACREAGRRVRERVWDPLATALAGAERVLVAPDGAVALVPFAALPTSGSRYLVEDEPLVHEVATEREVIEFSRAVKAGSGLLAFGGVDYGSRAAHDARRTTRGTAPGGGEAERSAPCENLGARTFTALPGSADEIAAIRTLWEHDRAGGDARLRTGGEASEKALRELAPGRRVLHLATHGFFVERACAQRLDESVDPLQRSGIVLAGSRAGGADSARTDGFVTASEIAGLDLSGVEWAVLSACRTGLGDIDANEGVLGLRRALRIAGVATVITSLWEVDDQAVRAWMQELYGARLERHLDTAAAMRIASRAVLRARREHGLGDHPRDWAPFVAVGDWR